MQHMARPHLTAVLVLTLLLTVSHSRELCPAVKRCLSRLRRGKSCPLLPVPKKALPGPPPADGFLLKELRPGVFSYSDGVYLAMILYKDRHLVLIDFPESAASFGPDGEYFLLTATVKVLAGSIPRKIDIVYSHRHIDHIGRAGFMKDFAEKTFPGAKILIWGTEETVRFLRRTEMSRAPEPNRIVRKSGRTIVVALGLKLQLRIVGGHTQMDLACHVLPSEGQIGVLHYVDVVTFRSVPFLDFGITIDLGRYIEAQKEVLKLDFDVFSPGHFGIGSKFDIERNVRYSEFVLEAATTAGAAVPPEKFAEIDRLVADPDAPQFQNGGWAIAQGIQLQAEVCTRRVIRKWGCILASADVFSPSHCKEAILFNLVDNQK